jgi:hypothetical protein
MLVFNCCKGKNICWFWRSITNYKYIHSSGNNILSYHFFRLFFVTNGIYFPFYLSSLKDTTLLFMWIRIILPIHKTLKKSISYVFLVKTANPFKRSKIFMFLYFVLLFFRYCSLRFIFIAIQSFLGLLLKLLKLLFYNLQSIVPKILFSMFLNCKPKYLSQVFKSLNSWVAQNIFRNYVTRLSCVQNSRHVIVEVAFAGSMEKI